VPGAGSVRLNLPALTARLSLSLLDPLNWTEPLFSIGVLIELAVYWSFGCQAVDDPHMRMGVLPPSIVRIPCGHVTSFGTPDSRRV
jgi:hypothetical protein